MPDTLTDTGTTATPEELAKASALLSGAEEGKRVSHASPYLRTFVESDEPFQICDMSLFVDFTEKEMLQNFKNAGKVTYHNTEDATGRTALYDIPGAYFVRYQIADGDLWLMKPAEILALVAAQKAATEEAAAEEAEDTQ